MSKEYWMIEKIINGQAHWLIINDPGDTNKDNSYEWTTDSSKADHYCNELLAIFVMADMPECNATGHVDM